MLLDRISKPTTFWYEDRNGNSVPFELTHGFPEGKEWHSQHSTYVLVQDSICFGNRPGKDLWIVRALKWLLRKCPNKWRKPEVCMAFNTTINCAYPIVKYLIEQRHFGFNDACVVSGKLCGRCLNMVLDDLDGKDAVLTPCDSNTFCKYCKEIDPLHHYKYIARRCYITMKRGESVEQEYKELTRRI